MGKKEESKREKAKSKKVYEKPRIIHQQSLEVMAGLCSEPLAAKPGVCTTLFT